MEEQERAKDEESKNKVIKVIKEKPGILRDTVEKKKAVVVVEMKKNSNQFVT